MKKSIFLFFAAILCAMSVSAKVIYFKPNGNWAAANANFYAYVWGGEGATPPVKFTPVATDPDVYEAEVGTHTSIIFLRHDPATTVTSDNMWSCWNRMGNLSIPTNGNNCCAINDGEGSQEQDDASSFVTWSTYTPPTEVVIPDRYITGTIAGGWNANDQIMTYDPETETYSHTFTAVAANAEQKFKVTDGTWNKNWGGDAVSPAIEGVTKDNDGNAVFTLSTGGDVTVTFDGTNIQLTTTGEIKVTIPDRYIAGIGGWSEKQVKMTYNEVSKLHEHTFAALAAGDYEFKITDGTWTNSWGKDGQNYPFNLPAAGDVTIKYNWKDNSIELILPEVTEPEPEPTELTYNVTVPAGTKACYICGNMTGWNFTEMTKVDDTHYTITIEGAKKNDGYKYASGGDWGYVEKDANGNEIGDRTYVDGNDVVARWASVYDPDAVEQELTYSVTVPEGTYACYIAMDTDPAQDGWEFNEMTKVDDTHYTFTRTGLKSKTYKYASGAGWEYVEKTDEDGEVADRTWAENDIVAKWASVYNPNATPEPVDHTYTVAGTEVPFGTNWNAEDTNNDMVNNGDGTYTWKRDNLEFKETKEVKFKVCEDHKWDVAYPASDYVLNIEKGYYTITITYTPADNNKVEATAEKTGEYNGDAPTHTYTIAGSAALCGVEWDYAATANDMTTADNVSYTWSKTGVEVKGNLEFKVFEDHSNSTAYPSNNWVINPVNYEGAAVYTVTITFNAETKEITVAMEKTGDVTPPVISYVLMGVNGDWTNGIPLTVNPDNADEYILTDQVIIKATDAIKVVTLTDGQATAWCGTVDSYSNATHTADGSGNIVLEDGIYTFYFKKTANNIYINQTGYARNVTNTYGTICLPYASASTSGATFYEVVGQETGKVYLASVTSLTAGVPYIFEKNQSATQIKVVYTGDKEDAASSANGLIGTFVDETAVPANNYILYGGKLCPTDGTAKVNAYRAYLDMSQVPEGAPQQMPGRRYIGMSVQGENETTGVEDIFTTDAPVKVIENGQLIIIRDGVKYNVQGQKL